MRNRIGNPQYYRTEYYYICLLKAARQRNLGNGQTMVVEALILTAKQQPQAHGINPSLQNTKHRILYTYLSKTSGSLYVAPRT